MDISILLALQDFRNGIGSIFTGFLLKMSDIGEMEVVLIIMALVYWCVSKKFGTYLLMGWSGSRVVNGLLKVTVCAYRPWIRDLRIVPNAEAMEAATGYSFPSGHSMNAAALFGGGAIRKELSKALRIVFVIIFALIAFSRIFLGVHTPQDILVGSAAGLLVMWLTGKLIDHIEADPKKDLFAMCLGIVIAVAVAIFAATKSYPTDYDAAGKLLVDGAKMAKDTYKGVGWCIGFLLGWVLERRYVRFSTDISMMSRIERLVFGLLTYFAVTLIMKALLAYFISGVAETILITFIQMFYVAFVFPWIFSKTEKKGTDTRL